MHQDSQVLSPYKWRTSWLLPIRKRIEAGGSSIPFLFILAMEGFDSMMRIAPQHRWIRDFNIGDRSGRGKVISHLLYADDTIIMCERKSEQLNFIRLILILFEAVSGLKVNWGKSSLIPVKDVPQIQNLANILGCKIEELPITYLGMPLGRKDLALEI